MLLTSFGAVTAATVPALCSAVLGIYASNTPGLLVYPLDSYYKMITFKLPMLSTPSSPSLFMQTCISLALHPHIILLYF